MNLALLLQFLKNVKQHPWTTVSGVLLATAMTLTNTHTTHDLLIAVGVAVMGAISKDPHR